MKKEKRKNFYTNKSYHNCGWKARYIKNEARYRLFCRMHMI